MVYEISWPPLIISIVAYFYGLNLFDQIILHIDRIRIEVRTYPSFCVDSFLLIIELTILLKEKA